MIPKWSQNDAKLIRRWSRNDLKMISKRTHHATKMLRMACKKDHCIRRSHCSKTSSRSLQSNFKNIWKQTSENGLTRPQYGGCKGWHQSKCLLPLWLLNPSPWAHILRPLEYLTGCGERGKRWNILSIIPLYVPEARPGRQGLEIMEERGEH